MRLTAMILALMIASGLVAATSLAADPVADPKDVDVQVLVIRATTKNKEISPELKELADKLRKQFKYTGFKLEKRDTGRAQLGSAYKTALIGGYEAAITPQRVDGKRLTLQVRVLKKNEEKPKLDMSVTIPAGEFQITGGWELDAGDALIGGFTGK